MPFTKRRDVFEWRNKKTLKFTAKHKLDYVSAQRTRVKGYFPCCSDLRPDEVRGQRGRGQWQERERRHTRLTHIKLQICTISDGALCIFRGRFSFWLSLRFVWSNWACQELCDFLLSLSFKEECSSVPGGWPVWKKKKYFQVPVVVRVTRNIKIWLE